MTDDAFILPDPPEGSRLWGMALIQDEAKRLPDSPGVYRMLGDGGEALYVGKQPYQAAEAPLQCGAA
jgi:excinuclease ABC subunit C